MDKQTKKDIKAVVKKYLKHSANTQPAILGSMNAAAVLVDLTLTGGAFSLGLLALNATVTAMNAAEIFNNRTMPRKNKAGQVIEANKTIALTLETIESKLKTEFKKAASPNPGELAMEKYEAAVHDARADVKTLSAAFNITSGGPRNMGTGEYQFIVWQRETAPGVSVPMTAEQGIAYLKEQAKKKDEAPEQKKRPGFAV